MKIYAYNKNKIIGVNYNTQNIEKNKYIKTETQLVKLLLVGRLLLVNFFFGHFHQTIGIQSHGLQLSNAIGPLLWVTLPSF